MKALHKLYTSFLVLLAAATDREMAKMLQYLKEENRTLRSKLPKRIELTPKERQRLVKLGRPLGGKIRELITIASQRTFVRWVSGDPTSVGKKAKTGRRRTEEQLRGLIVSIARDLGAGYTRVMGELKKLGINECSATVRIDGGMREVEIENRDGTTRRFRASRTTTTTWAPATVVEPIFTPEDEPSSNDDVS